MIVRADIHGVVRITQNVGGISFECLSNTAKKNKGYWTIKDIDLVANGWMGTNGQRTINAFGIHAMRRRLCSC